MVDAAATLTAQPTGITRTEAAVDLAAPAGAPIPLSPAMQERVEYLRAQYPHAERQ